MESVMSWIMLCLILRVERMTRILRSESADDTDTGRNDTDTA